MSRGGRWLANDVRQRTTTWRSKPLADAAKLAVNEVVEEKIWDKKIRAARVLRRRNWELDDISVAVGLTVAELVGHLPPPLPAYKTPSEIPSIRSYFSVVTIRRRTEQKDWVCYTLFCAQRHLQPATPEEFIAALADEKNKNRGDQEKLATPEKL